MKHSLILIVPVVMLSQTVLAEEMAQISVTATKEVQSSEQQSVTVDVIDTKTIKTTHPSHPSELLDQLPGVHVNITGGEGHMTAIRHPLTTSPVYLYLEDGLPTRSPGFFNHNALYEVNIPQSGGVEVLKGPATSLYGSDAIGGVVNVLTAALPDGREKELDLEYGGFGWTRLLYGQARGDQNGGVSNKINITHSDGWRNATDYDRQSYTGRYENYTNSGALIKTILSISNIDQQTAGSSALSYSDYINNPDKNKTPISYRRVQALRLSSEIVQETSDSVLSVTPYLRSNNMDIMPNWSLSYDPTIYSTGHSSLGVNLRHRKDLDNKNVRIISGVDMDYSPGSRVEHSIIATKDADGIYTDYSLDQLIYDYAVAYSAISPYLHTEYTASKKWRFDAGLRYDMMSFDYDNHLSALSTGSHRRPGDTIVSFQHPSPKIGAIYTINKQHNTYVSYRHAFRVPSESQLFRQGSSLDSTGLKPVRADSLEWGLRGSLSNNSRYQLAVYDMRKADDILQYDDGVDRYYANAGETRHRGIELGMKKNWNIKTDMSLAYSYAQHTLTDWQPKVGVDYSGNELAAAPNEMLNLKVSYKADMLNGGSASLELKSIGSYWMDDANSQKYPGHQLVNVYSDYKLSKDTTINLRILNLLNEKYATRATYHPFRGAEYAPGMPLNIYLGMNMQL